MNSDFYDYLGMWIVLVFIVLGVVVSIPSCLRQAEEVRTCREVGGQPLVDRFNNVACLPKNYNDPRTRKID